MHNRCINIQFMYNITARLKNIKKKINFVGGCGGSAAADRVAAGFDGVRGSCGYCGGDGSVDLAVSGQNMPFLAEMLVLGILFPK